LTIGHLGLIGWRSAGLEASPQSNAVEWPNAAKSVFLDRMAKKMQKMPVVGCKIPNPILGAGLPFLEK
jgi:hypothetical protein